MEANDTNSLETEVPLDNNLNSPYCIFSLLSNFMKKYSELIYNNIENELLKDVTYSQILISFLLLWILYRVYNSIDLHKILHKFTYYQIQIENKVGKKLHQLRTGCYRKSTEIDANIINKMEKYWVKKLTTGVETCNGKLPDEPWSEDTIKEKISQLAQKEGVNCPNGGVIRHPYKSESDCKSNSDKVAKEANGMFFKSNPLHFDIFDGVCKMEAEVIQMCNNLYKGGDSGCGIVDTSEADCIRDAALAYKKWAKESPATFDPSLERACLMLEIEFRRVSVGDDVRVFVEDIIAKTDSNTVAIFCSAPDQYFGVIDPVEKIAEYAHQNYIGCHVDCNYSSFFMNVGLSMLEREFNINFEVKGITSIGVSLSRYYILKFIYL